MGTRKWGYSMLVLGSRLEGGFLEVDNPPSDSANHDGDELRRLLPDATFQKATEILELRDAYVLVYSSGRITGIRSWTIQDFTDLNDRKENQMDEEHYIQMGKKTCAELRQSIHNLGYVEKSGSPQLSYQEYGSYGIFVNEFGGGVLAGPEMEVCLLDLRDASDSKTSLELTKDFREFYLNPENDVIYGSFIRELVDKYVEGITAIGYGDGDLIFYLLRSSQFLSGFGILVDMRSNAQVLNVDFLEFLRDISVTTCYFGCFLGRLDDRAQVSWRGRIV